MVYYKAFRSLIELFQRLVVHVKWRPLYDFITVEVSPELHDSLLVSKLAVRTESVGDLCQVNEWLKIMQFGNRGSSHGSAETTLLQRKHFDQSLFHFPLKNAFAAIEQDDTLGLDQQLRRTRGISEIDLHSWQQFLFALLHFSAVSRLQQCTVRLLSDIAYI